MEAFLIEWDGSDRAKEQAIDELLQRQGYEHCAATIGGHVVKNALFVRRTSAALTPPAKFACPAPPVSGRPYQTFPSWKQ